MAGIAVPESSLPAYRQALADAKAKRKQASELHGVDLMKSESGQRCVLTLLRTVFAAGCEPIWTAAEKRYCVAAKIVETFFDPYYNEAANWLQTGANAARQRVANEFDSLSTSFLKQFAEAYRNPTEQKFLESARSLHHAMNLTGRPRLAQTLAGTIECISEIYAAEETVAIGGKRYVSTSLNLPIFSQFIMHADRLLKASGASEVDVVHDQTSEFEAGFRWVFDTFGQAKETTIVLQDGTEVYIGFSSVKNFRTGDSVKEVEIQGADLLASALRTIFIEFLKGRELSPTLLDLAKLIFGKHPESALGNFWLMGNDKFWSNFVRFYKQHQLVRIAA